MKKLYKLFAPFRDRSFFTFVIIGAVNTVHGFVYSSLYSAVLDPNTAFALGYLTSLLLGYLMNARFSFKARPNGKALGKYALSYIPNFLLQNAVVFLVYNIMGLHKFLAYGAAAVLGMPLTYLLVRTFAFGKKLTTK